MRGLDRDTNKALLLKHIMNIGKEGAPFQELSQVLPSLPRSTIQRLLRELRDEGLIIVSGERRHARWVTQPLGGKNRKRSKG